MSENEARMTFTEHLAELRVRIIRSAIAIAIGFVICYIFSNAIFDVVSGPLAPQGSGQVSSATPPLGADGKPVVPEAPPAAPETPPPSMPDDTTAPDEPAAPDVPAPMPVRWFAGNPLEAFLVRLKLAGYGGLVLASPFLIYQICAFIFPGLTPREKKAATFLLSGSSLLGLAGVFTAYFGVFPLIMPYLGSFLPKGVDLQFRMGETVAMILLGMLGFAVAFQFPIVVMVLVFLDLLHPDTLRKYRRVAIPVMAIGAAILTPPDPISMMIMLIPLMLLYEISIWLSYIMIVRGRERAAGAGKAK